MDGYPVSPPQDSYPGDKWKGADLPLRVKEGDDRVDNIMDYSTDACYTGFSSKQIRWTRDLWALLSAAEISGG
jgi:hypothetical protein